MNKKEPLYKKWWLYPGIGLGIIIIFIIARGLPSDSSQQAQELSNAMIGLLVVCAIGFFIIRKLILKIKKNKQAEVTSIEPPIYEDNTDIIPNEPSTVAETSSSDPVPPKPIIPEVPAGYQREYLYQNILIKNIGVLHEGRPGDYLDIKEHTISMDEKVLGLFLSDKIIGLFPQNRLSDMVYDFRKKGGIALAVIQSIDYNNDFEIAISYYYEHGHHYNKLLSRDWINHKTFKLNGNSSEKTQEEIFLLTIRGNELELEYDEDKEKYAVIDFDYIGYLPKNANLFIESCLDYRAFVEEVFDKDNGMLGVSVDIFDV
jgi:hypothetical protein